ncbi:WD40/YVTN/BNR-like repeat-containing protein [Aestuariibacter salexigens]|uniref:WD40/YVTN/BNR-like repeat-containing protein n=1 Tax=Aestuariibacter salexigens TaxID=226010 RepID=UPI000684E4FC|nr:YCF48-related protein [Aestuariibacter salexigens]
MNTKKLIRYVAGITLLATQAQAATSWQAKLATESLLLDMSTFDNHLVVVGERGHVLLSEDGDTFEQLSVPTVATLTAVDTVGDDIWAVGHDTTIIHSADRGQTWQQQLFLPELEKPLLDVLFFDSQHGIAIGAYGIFYRTQDGGQNWTVEKHPTLLHPDDQAYLEDIRQEDEAFYQTELDSIMPHLNRVSLHDGMLYLAGEAGLLAKSEDMGQSWQRMEIDYMGSFFDIVFDGGRLLATGLRGHLFEYVEELQSWAELDTCSLASFNSIVPLDGDNALVVGNNGYVLSINGTVMSQERANISANENCVTGQQLVLSQTEDSQAIINATLFNDKVIAVTAAGIQVLTQD